MRSRPVGVLVAIAFVAGSTALIYPLEHAAPVVSLGVVYLVGVLAVAAGWGLLLGLGTALVSAAAFNYFHIPPTGGFTISRAQNSVALVVYLIVAVAASTLSEIARTRRLEAEARREEADLVAATARDLLLGAGGDDGVEALGRRLTAMIGVPARVVPGPPDGAEAMALHDPGGRPVAALELDGVPDAGQANRLSARIVPALEPLVAAALDRERLLAEVVETQALRRSDEVKTALLRAVSHDLRTPLTSIMASGEALASDALEPEERRDLSAAVSGEARRLSDLIDKLLDLSRLQGGQAVPRRDWVALDEVIRAAIAQLPPDTPVHLSLDARLPLVRVDGAQLERALVNVLDNAARHSAGRPVHVRAHARGDTLAIRIVDEGPGIAPGLQERVFEPFWRGKDGATDHHGAGLGLAIARGFVEANGGRLVVEPNVGRGAVFVLRLPVEPVPVPVR